MQFFMQIFSFIRISADSPSQTIRVIHSNVYFLLFCIVLMLTQITQDDVFCLFFFLNEVLVLRIVQKNGHHNGRLLEVMC